MGFLIFENDPKNQQCAASIKALGEFDGANISDGKIPFFAATLITIYIKSMGIPAYSDIRDVDVPFSN